MIGLKEVPITSIVFGERFREDYGDLSQLIESFKKEGIIQPLAVRDNGDGTYFLLAGGRRYTAATKAGLDSLPVRCYPSTLSELEMRSIELMENVLRKDLEWLEAAKLKKEILQLQKAIHGEKVSTAKDAPGVSQADIAKMLGVTPALLSQELKLVEMAEVFPALGTTKNKADASKMLSKMQESLVREELAKRIEGKAATTPIERVYGNLINSYIVGNFFEGIKQVPNNSIDFIELDPPYAIDLNATKRNMGELRAEHYNEIDQDDYIKFLIELFKECYRVMSANSWIVMWHGKEWLPIIVDMLENGELSCNYNTTGIWYKGAVGQTNTPNLYLASCYEQFVYIRKGTPSIVRQGRSNVFHYKPVTAVYKIHPTERPIELIQDIMQTFCWEGARCLVPFLGSGNSILAAANLGMSAFGWDLSQEYKNGFVVRVSESKPTAYRSYKEKGENNA